MLKIDENVFSLSNLLEVDTTWNERNQASFDYVAKMSQQKEELPDRKTSDVC